MPLYLGIDTSNYTTSATFYDSKTGRVLSQKRLLPVAQGEAGLRQSDALFAHVKQLPEVLEALFRERREPLAAVGASFWPRRAEGSYMPAFLAGAGTASAIASSQGIPLHAFSHQEGHIAAALHSAGALDWLKGSFYAFHVSGGTTECLLTEPEGGLFRTETVARTLDLNAGQLIDRIGVRLGMAFPCGAELDRLSCQSGEAFRPRPAFSGMDCHFSGAQNQCQALLAQGASPQDAARWVMEYVAAAVEGMAERVMARHGERPLLCAGGVMCSSLLRERLTARFGARFAAPEFSADNASGPAVLAALREGALTG